MKTKRNINNTLAKTIDENLNKNSSQSMDETIAQAAANLLSVHAQQHLNTATLQRLSSARHLAVNQLASHQTQTAHDVHQSGSVLQWLSHGFSNYSMRHRMASATMMAGVIIFTFFATQQLKPAAINNLESGDAFLLASDLPPEAFADKGFDTWVVSK